MNYPPLKRINGNSSGLGTRASDYTDGRHMHGAVSAVSRETHLLMSLDETEVDENASPRL